MCDKQPWTQFEDESLTAAVIETGEGFKWITIENILRVKYGIKNRSSKQCRERWSNNLDPNCRKREWTEEEDAIIFTYQQKVGNNWSKISKFLIGRSDNTIKNHFYATEVQQAEPEKIRKPLKEIINDKHILKLLISVPEKVKKDSINEIRRSNRLISKNKSEVSNEKLTQEENFSENSEYNLDSLSNLLQLSTFNFTSPIKEDCEVKQYRNAEPPMKLPSFTLNSSFQFHNIDN